jgi:hypothetical protein
MTDAEKARHAGLVRALAEFEELLAKSRLDEEPVDTDDLSRLPVYTKETER